MVLACNFALFDLHQRIYLIDADNQEQKEVGISSMENLAFTLAELCNKYSCNHIHLFGNGNYGMNLAEDINHYALNKYGMRDIIIEVN